MKKIIIALFIGVILAATLSFSVLAAEESEPNDGASTATEIAVNTAVTGQLESDRDVDWYRFTVTESGYFWVDFQHELIDSTRNYWRIFLYEENGSAPLDGINFYFSVPGNSTAKTNKFGIAAGTYCIKIEDDYYSDISYTLTVNFTASVEWESENNNSKNTADEIQVNKTVNAALTQDGDTDWYRFTVAEAGFFKLDFKHELIDSTRNYWAIRLYDETAVTPIDDVSSRVMVTGNQNAVSASYGIPAGTYYLAVAKEYYSGVDYQLTLNFTASDEWESENNNTKESADTLPLNKALHGAFSADGDVDWYRFTVEENGFVNLSFDHELIDNGNTFWRIRFYDESGVNQIDGTTSYFPVKGNANLVTNTFGIPAGTYLIRIEKEYYSGVDYTITLQHTPATDWETELNNTKALADEIKPNQKYNGALSTLGDVDWFYFDLAADCQLSLTFGHDPAEDSRTCWVITLYDESGVTGLTGFKAFGHLSPRSSDELLLPAGRYYVSIACDSYLGVNYFITAAEKHNCVGSFRVTKDPTCIEFGRREKECTVCGTIFAEEEIDPLGHRVTDWTVTMEPTCLDNGNRHGTCTACEEVCYETIPTLGHAFGDYEIVSGSKLIPPIVSERSCSQCNEVETLKDWSYVWILILVIVGAVGILIGVINYIKAFKKK